MQSTTKNKKFRPFPLLVLLLSPLIFFGCAAADKQSTPDVSIYLTRIAELESQLLALQNAQQSTKTPPPELPDDAAAIFHYRVENGRAFVTRFTGTESFVILPASLDGYPVFGIDDRAFEGASFLSITLPEGLAQIGWFAFYDCAEMIEIHIPDSVTTIEYGAFDGCERLHISCSADSFAQSYAESYGIPYTAK